MAPRFSSFCFNSNAVSGHNLENEVIAIKAVDLQLLIAVFADWGWSFFQWDHFCSTLFQLLKGHNW